MFLWPLIPHFSPTRLQPKELLPLRVRLTRPRAEHGHNCWPSNICSRALARDIPNPAWQQQVPTSSSPCMGYSKPCMANKNAHILEPLHRIYQTLHGEQKYPHPGALARDIANPARQQHIPTSSKPCTGYTKPCMANKNVCECQRFHHASALSRSPH